MSKKEFEDFLSKKKKEVPDATFWDNQKKEWLAYLNILYKKFEDALKDYVGKGQIKISYDEITIREEPIGNYKAKRMRIDILDHKIVLTPVGTSLIAAKGRVDMTDMRGRATTVRIVLVDSRAQRLRDHIKVSVFPAGEAPKEIAKPEKESIIWEWKFVTPPPAGVYHPVNADTIYTTMMDMLNA